MTAPWFRRVGWIPVPISIPGGIVTIGALTFCVHVFIAVDGRSHSVTDTLYGVYPFIIPTLLLLDWVATRSSVSASRRS